MEKADSKSDVTSEGFEFSFSTSSGRELQVKIFERWFINDQLLLTRPQFPHNCCIPTDAFSASLFTVMLAASEI